MTGRRGWRLQIIAPLAFEAKPGWYSEFRVTDSGRYWDAHPSAAA